MRWRVARRRRWRSRHWRWCATEDIGEGKKSRRVMRRESLPYLPKPQTSGNLAKGQFGKRDFLYIAEDDEYLCPAGERAIYRFTREESGKQTRRYWSSACIRCSMKPQCTSGDYRRISRWEHEAVTDAAEARLERAPEVMQARRQTVEHPFGTLKAWMGATHFLMKTLPKVSTEMSLGTDQIRLNRFTPAREDLPCYVERGIGVSRDRGRCCAPRGLSSASAKAGSPAP